MTQTKENINRPPYFSTTHRLKKSALSISLIFEVILSLFLFGSCHTPTSLKELPMQFVQLPDQTHIAYKIYGDGRTTLVFVHGFGCNMYAWDHQFNYFKDKATMVFVDLPGYGQSNKPHTDYSLDYYAEALKAVMEKEQIQQVVLVGHSLGTPVCRQLIFNNPKLVSKFVDIDGVYCFYPNDSLTRAENKALYETFANSFDGDHYKGTLKEFITPLFVQNTPQTVKLYALKTMMQTPQYVASSTMKDLVNEKYWTGKIIATPSLIIASTNSLLPPNYEQMMGNLYADMQYCEWDNIGHFIMMEQPKEFNRLLFDFIQQ